jgi:nucleotide-binding universal stress UspA family protein
MLPIKKIISPTDFSELSDLGLKAAIELAEHFSAELLVVHVVAPLSAAATSAAPAAHYLPEVMESIRNNAESLLKMMEKKYLNTLRSKSILLEGSPADEIAEYTKEVGADLIVIATHGQSGWRRFMFGSVTEKVMRLSKSPVLIIGSQEKSYKSKNNLGPLQ